MDASKDPIGSAISDWWTRHTANPRGFQPNWPSPYGKLGMEMPQSAHPMAPGIMSPQVTNTGNWGPSVGPAADSFQPPPSNPPAAGFTMPPMPPTRPQGDALDGFMATTAPSGGLGMGVRAGRPPGVPVAPPMPPPRPPELSPPAQPPGSNWGSYNDSGNPADFARADHADMVGPGSWLPKDMSKMFDPNSIAGKIMGMSNPRPGPGKQPEPQGLLPQLYSGLFGGGSPGPYTGAPINDDRFI